MRHAMLVSLTGLLLAAGSAVQADQAPAPHPQLSGNLLTLPRVDSAERPGQYQAVRFERQADGRWQLLGFEAQDTPRIGKVLVDQVEVVKTNAFPVAIYLRASGGQAGCGFDGLAQVSQRRVGDRFEVSISARHNDFATQQITQTGSLVCTMDYRPYKMTVPLAVYGLRAGSYAYSVNGVTGRFTLDADNVLPGDCDAGEPAERRTCTP